MPRAAVKRAVGQIGSAAADLGAQRLGATFNILVGGPGTTLQTAVDDALTTACFALEAGRAAGISVDLNLYPYYRSTRGQEHFPLHPRCSAETVARAASAVAELARSCVPPSVLWIGTNDEGHDPDFTPSGWPAGAVREALDKFNGSQDPSALEFMCREQSA
jgi:hypothetical protein